MRRIWAGSCLMEKKKLPPNCKSKEQRWLVITLDLSKLYSFIEIATTKLRRNLSCAFGAKVFHNDVFDNQKNIIKITNLQHKGPNYWVIKTHAHYVWRRPYGGNPEGISFP